MDERDKLGELQLPDGNGNFPTEPKVKAARIAALLGGIVVSFLLKTLPFLSGEKELVLEIVTDVILGAILAGLVWFAGWKARHVQRQLNPQDPTRLQ
jgi:hypothetical protein